MKLSSATSTKPAHCQINKGDSNLENLLSELFWLSLVIGLEHLNPDKMYAPYFSTYGKLLTLFPHNLQLDKLIAYELGPHILSWLHSYLADRKQHVVVGGESSPVDSSVPSGVTQGSVLGPLLFLIYIDDASSLELSEGSVLNVYADDMLLYKSVKCSEDYQLDIDKISTWVGRNLLSLNPVKFKTMLLSRKRKRNLSQPPQFLLNETQLEQVESFKYLGVLISLDLSWSAHIDSICAKGKKHIGLLYISFSSK